MLNASADTSSPLAVSGLAKVDLFGGAEVAPLGELVVVEGVAFLVGAALVHAVANRLASGEAGVSDNVEVVVPA